MFKRDITDEQTGEKVGEMFLLPPAAGKCQDCAIVHEAGLPHDATSLFYQTKFQLEHGRGATWEDAMAHCVDLVKEGWGAQLDEFGIDWRNGALTPPKAKR